MRLKGKTAVVTGAGSGFGAAIARLFAQEGARVALADRDEAAAAAVAAEIEAAGGTAMAVRTDVADGASVAAMVKAVVDAWGGFDVLVNNAGIAQKPAPVHRIAEDEIDRLFAVNVKSLYHTTVHALPVLRAGGGGAIVNIASNAALRPRPGMAWYNATKAAVMNLTMTMSSEYARYGIRVNAIAPSLANTPMKTFILGEPGEGDEAVRRSIPLGRFAEPEDIARAALYLASADASFVTGIVMPVDGGRTALG